MNKQRRMRPLMGTFVEIGVDGTDVVTSQAVSEAFSTMEQVDRLLSFHKADSELTRLNRYGLKGVELSPLSADVLRLALHMTGATDGAFNCTVGGMLVQHQMLPDHGGVRPLPAGTAEDVELNGCHARLLRPVRITLDGIAKGYAVDQAVNVLQRHGIDSGWINAGGDLRVFGDTQQPLHRRELDGQLTFLGNFSNIAVATSSVGREFDQRFPGMVFDGIQRRLKRGCWTVKAPQLWLADALTKVAAVASNTLAEKIITALGGERVLGLTL